MEIKRGFDHSVRSTRYGEINRASSQSAPANGVANGNFAALVRQKSPTPHHHITSGAMPVAQTDSLDSLLALEAIDPDNQREHKQQRQQQQQDEESLETHAQALIDELQNLQLQLLEGQVDRVSIENLQEKLAKEKAAMARANPTMIENNPQLLRIMRDIELRAAVELAKLKNISAF